MNAVGYAGGGPFYDANTNSAAVLTDLQTCQTAFANANANGNTGVNRGVTEFLEESVTYFLWLSRRVGSRYGMRMNRSGRRFLPRKWRLIRFRVVAVSGSLLVSRTFCWMSLKIVSSGLSSGLRLGRLVPCRCSRRISPDYSHPCIHQCFGSLCT